MRSKVKNQRDGERNPVGENRKGRGDKGRLLDTRVHNSIQEKVDTSPKTALMLSGTRRRAHRELPVLVPEEHRHGGKTETSNCNGGCEACMSRTRPS